MDELIGDLIEWFKENPDSVEIIMQMRTLILVAVSILAACSNRTMTITVDKAKMRTATAAELATQLESIKYPAAVTNEGETLLIRVGAASLPDVRRAMCHQMGWPGAEGKMVQLAGTLRLLRWTGVTKLKIIGDTETLDVELEQVGHNPPC